MTWEIAFTIACPLLTMWGWYWGRKYERKLAGEARTIRDK